MARKTTASTNGSRNGVYQEAPVLEDHRFGRIRRRADINEEMQTSYLVCHPCRSSSAAPCPTRATA